MGLLEFIHDLGNAGLSNAQKHQSFVDFVAYFDGLKNEVLGNRVIAPLQLSVQIFKRKWKEREAENVFKNHLYAAHFTLHRYAPLINAGNFEQFSPILQILAYDLYNVVAYTEINIRHNPLNFRLGVRPAQEAREIFDVSCRIMNLDLNAYYPRELIPISIFLIRQTLEVYAKQTLGYTRITDGNGNRVRVSPHIAWDFIKKETSSPHNRITLPVNMTILMKVEEWTNYYVHSGNIPELFLTDNALEFITPLIYPLNQTPDYRRVKVFNGTSHIRDYNSLKADFTKFVNTKRSENFLISIWYNLLNALRISDTSNARVVEWLDHPEATVINL